MIKKSALSLILDEYAKKRIARLFPFAQNPQTAGSNLIDPEKVILTKDQILEIIKELYDTEEEEELIEAPPLNIPLSIYLNSIPSDTDAEKISPIIILNLTDYLTRTITLYEIDSEAIINDIDFFSLSNLEFDAIDNDYTIDAIEFWSWSHLSFNSIDESKVESIAIFTNDGIFIEESIVSTHEDNFKIELEGQLVIAEIEHEVIIDDLIINSFGDSLIEIATIDNLNVIEYIRVFLVDPLLPELPTTLKDDYIDLFDIKNTQLNLTFQVSPTDEKYSILRPSIELNQINTTLFFIEHGKSLLFSYKVLTISPSQNNTRFSANETIINNNIDLFNIRIDQKTLASLLLAPSIETSIGYLNCCLDQASILFKNFPMAKLVIFRISDTFSINLINNISMPLYEMRFNSITQSLKNSFIINTIAKESSKKNTEYFYIDFFKFKNKIKVYAINTLQEKTIEQFSQTLFTNTTAFNSSFQIDQFSLSYENEFSSNELFLFM